MPEVSSDYYAVIAAKQKEVWNHEEVEILFHTDYYGALAYIKKWKTYLKLQGVELRADKQGMIFQKDYEKYIKLTENI